MIDLTRFWWPVATHAEFEAGKPLTRRLHGVRLRYFAIQLDSLRLCSTLARTAVHLSIMRVSVITPFFSLTQFAPAVRRHVVTCTRIHPAFAR